jgi:small multidrug resistance pump
MYTLPLVRFRAATRYSNHRCGHRARLKGPILAQLMGKWRLYCARYRYSLAGSHRSKASGYDLHSRTNDWRARMSDSSASAMAVSSLKNWILLYVAILAEVVATSLLKSSEGFTRPWPSLAVIAGYGIAFYSLSLTLRSIQVGIAYAVWSGVGIVLVTLVAWLVHDQKLDVPAVVGIGLIVSGVVVLQLFSKTATH